MSKKVFWIENPYILFEKEELVNFVPNKDMSILEKMNAVTRFCLYGLIIGQLFNFSNNIMYMLCSIIILIIISYKLQSPENEISESLDLFTEDQINTLSNKLSEILMSKNGNEMEQIGNNEGKCNSNMNSTNESQEEFDNVILNKAYNNQAEKCNNTNQHNQDSRDTLGNLIRVKGEDSNNKDNNQNNQINQDHNESNQISEKCTEPTKDNPLMNINIGDDPNKPKACEYTDEIKENINEKYNYNLYRDVDDLFERHNSQRQFFTMPENNQQEFAEWLYKAPETCKESSLCLRNEDKRYHN